MNPADAVAPAPSLSRNRSFNLFWFSQMLDALGDSFSKIGLPLLVLASTGSVAKMGLVTALNSVGVAAASISANFFIDRLERRRLMILCDIGRAFFYLSIPVSWWLLGNSIVPVCIAAAGAAYLGTLFVITSTAAIPSLVSNEQLMQANGRLQATIGVAFILGPMLAGLASGRLGARTAIGAIAVLYALSAVLLAFMRMRQTVEEQEARGSTLQEVLAGVRFMFGHPVLKWAAILFSVFALTSEATIDLAIFRLEHDLHQSEQTVGWVFGLAGLGAVLSGLLAHTLRQRWGFGASFLGGLLVQGGAILGLGISPNLGVTIAMAVSFACGMMIRNINTMSLRQEVTPKHLLGRVSAAFWTIIALAGPIGAFVGTTLAESQGASTVLVGMGALGLVVAIAGFSTPARTSTAQAAGAA